MPGSIALPRCHVAEFWVETVPLLVHTLVIHGLTPLL